VAVAGCSLAALGLVGEAVAGSALGALVGATGVFVAGIATTIPAAIALITARTGHARGAGSALYSFAAFLGASAGSIVAGLGLGFASLQLVLAAVLTIAAGLVTLSGRPRPPGARNPPSHGVSKPCIQTQQLHGRTSGSTCSIPG
jgi:MFS family permease